MDACQIKFLDFHKTKCPGTAPGRGPGPFEARSQAWTRPSPRPGPGPVQGPAQAQLARFWDPEKHQKYENSQNPHQFCLARSRLVGKKVPGHWTGKRQKMNMFFVIFLGGPMAAIFLGGPMAAIFLGPAIQLKNQGNVTKLRNMAL